MKVYGYKRDGEKEPSDFVELSEASIECSLNELEKIISFLETVKNQHSKVALKTELCHSHYRDWDGNWDENSTDIIVITPF